MSCRPTPPLSSRPLRSAPQHRGRAISTATTSRVVGSCVACLLVINLCQVRAARAPMRVTGWHMRRSRRIYVIIPSYRVVRRGRKGREGSGKCSIVISTRSIKISLTYIVNTELRACEREQRALERAESARAERRLGDWNLITRIPRAHLDCPSCGCGVTFPFGCHVHSGTHLRCGRQRWR